MDLVFRVCELGNVILTQLHHGLLRSDGKFGYFNIHQCLRNCSDAEVSSRLSDIKWWSWEQGWMEQLHASLVIL